MVCRKILFEVLDVAMHGLDEWLALAIHPIAVGRQRCAATGSSRGGRCSYPFFFSAINRCESSWSRRTDARRVGGVPQYRELVWTSGKKRCLIAPREKTLVQPAARWLLSGDHSSPSSLTLMSLCHSSAYRRPHYVTRTAVRGRGQS